MARSSGKTPWHTVALRLHADGLTAPKIVEALKDTPNPPALEAVKKFLARSKRDPAKALQLVAVSAPSEPPPRAPLSPEDAKVIDRLFVVLEKHRAETIRLALRTARVFLRTDPNAISKEHYMKLNGALEVLRVLKTSGDGPRPEGGEEGPEGGANKPGGKGSFDPEEQRRRARERRKELATPTT